ncbi:hypothetical protein, partial [Streptomyces sp. MH13]|uniref:hypothetical protein n=1 Tax=Streptomyces sp. MH13 TaxID=3417651 RepID=UPI003CFB92E9
MRQPHNRAFGIVRYAQYDTLRHRRATLDRGDQSSQVRVLHTSTRVRAYDRPPTGARDLPGKLHIGPLRREHHRVLRP